MNDWVTVATVISVMAVSADAVVLRMILRHRENQIETLKGLVEELEAEVYIHRDAAGKALARCEK